MTACHRIQEQERHLYEHDCLVSQHADSDITMDSAYTIYFHIKHMLTLDVATQQRFGSKFKRLFSAKLSHIDIPQSQQVVQVRAYDKD